MFGIGYGFNGKEKDQTGEFSDLTYYDYGFRIYNPAIARFLSVDPLAREYPWYTPYQFAGNKPIWAIDLDGLEEGRQDVDLEPGLMSIRATREERLYYNEVFLKATVGGGSLIGIGIVAPVAAPYLSNAAGNLMIRGALFGSGLDVSMQIANGSGDIFNRIANLDISDIVISGMQGSAFVYGGSGMLKLSFLSVTEYTKAKFDYSSNGFKEKETKDALMQATLAVSLSYMGDLFKASLNEIMNSGFENGLKQAQSELRAASTYKLKGGKDNLYVTEIKGSLKDLQNQIDGNKKAIEILGDISTAITTEEIKK